MFKIEKALLIAQENTNSLTFLNVIKEFLKETNMLVSNIHLAHIHLEKEVGNSFPVETNKYDGSWYKNLLIAAEIIIDRLYSRIDENKDYLKMLDDVLTCDFVEFSKKWNKINFMVKYNMDDASWNRLCKEYNISSTSRKLEELIAKNVVINLPLLRGLSLDLNSYRSVAKELDNKGAADFDSLLEVLSPELVNKEQAPAQAVAADANKPQPAPAPNTSTIGVVREKGPLSPVKREMDQILKWITLRDEEIREFKRKQSIGYSPEEYKKMLSQLESVQLELKLTDEQLNDAKKSVPIDPMAREMAAIVRWAKEQEAQIKRYNRYRNGLANKEELAQLQKFLSAVQNELVMIESELKLSKENIPVDGAAREMAQILRWIQSRQPEIREYKRKLVGQSINEELRLIEKELGINNQKQQDIQETIKYINMNKPVDPYKKELDELLRWISRKEKELRTAKSNAIKAERQAENKIKQELLEIIKEAQRRVGEELSDVNHDIKANSKIVAPKKAPLRLPAASKKSSKQSSLVPTKVKKAAPKASISKEKLYDITEIYKVEADVLRAAMEILPSELAKNGKKALPKMLQHLLDKGYIELDDKYELDSKHEFKLKEKKKVLA